MWATWGGLYYGISPKEAHYVGYLRRVICYSPQGGPLFDILGEAVMLWPLRRSIIWATNGRLILCYNPQGGPVFGLLGEANIMLEPPRRPIMWTAWGGCCYILAPKEAHCMGY